MPPIIDENKCTGCGICVEVCSFDVYFDSEKKKIPTITYPDECWHCNSCVLDCPEKAISLRIPLNAMLLCK